MRKITLFLLLATIGAFCFSCAGWPWNKKLPKPPQGMETVKLSAVIVGRETFDQINKDGITYEQAREIWHRAPSVTIYFREARCAKKYENRDPRYETCIWPEGAKYPVYFCYFKMRRFDDHGVVVLYAPSRDESETTGRPVAGNTISCETVPPAGYSIMDFVPPDNMIFYGKTVIEFYGGFTPSGGTLYIDSDAVGEPNLTVRSREWLDANKDMYVNLHGVGEITVCSDGKWWEGVQNVSPDGE